jgi:Anti-sigma factor NepR
MMLSAVEDSPERAAAQEQAADKGKAPVSTRAPRGTGTDRDMGSALRSIYQRTVEEQVPDEMLSLLSKLD